MAMKTVNPADRAAVLAVIDPDANAAATITTAWLSMAEYQSMMAIVMAGTLGTSATIDAKIEQAQDASGTGAKDLAGAAITQLTQAGGDSDKQAIVQWWAEDLDLANAFTHVRLSMTTAAATSDSGALVIGFDKRTGTAQSGDVASVAEIVTA